VLPALAKLHASDLYLAWGCTRSDQAALAAFERSFMGRLAAHLRRAEALPAFTDEVRQAVRVRLLVSEDGLVPRIASYRGQGPLAVWLRLTATRLAINLRKAGAREPDSNDGIDVERLRSDDGDPELAFLKSHYREELRAAVEGALASLPVNDGNILRLHFFERLSADAMGAMFGVSARTVHRWITDIRTRIVAETRRLLSERFSISQTQMDSLVGLVGSQLEISIRRILEK
jgi:RNA polymerase sigma-70 factor (ECF subfamily)